jgi:hypothetical protein
MPTPNEDFIKECAEDQKDGSICAIDSGEDFTYGLNCKPAGKNGDDIVECSITDMDSGGKIKVQFNRPEPDNIKNLLESSPFINALKNLNIRSIDFNKGIDSTIRGKKGGVL